MANRLDFVVRANAAYIEQQYARFRENRESVSEDWALFFAGLELGQSQPGAASTAPTAGEVFGLVQHHRVFGHLAAHLDPLSGPPPVPSVLEPEAFGFGEADLDTPVSGVPFKGEFRGTVRGLLAALRETYCRTLGVEYMEISDAERREWLEERMEPGLNHAVLGPEDRLRILARLLAADRFEEFLHARYPGQKRFSLEGSASLLPMLDALVQSAASIGVETLVIGMPHRGRLNVLANLLNKPLAAIFSEFESSFLPEDVQGDGDVKYHLGYSSVVKTRAARALHLDLHFNPSHLEFVNPVVLGAMRARQDLMRDLERDRGFAVLIHGDAAFSGEGIVPETLALAQLPAYCVGGTVHILINNQIGFTTSPRDARVSRYATDVARVEDAPIFHVNADDPEACVQAVLLAVAYRARWKRDAFVDLIGYRKHGHNELDDPTFTQPVLYRKIAAHTPVSKRYAESLLEEGVLDETRWRAMESEIADSFQVALERARTEPSSEGAASSLGGAWAGLEWAGDDWSAKTAVPREVLERIVRSVTQLPEGFHPHRKVAQLAAERVRMVEQDRIDWGCGELLSYGTLLLEGRNVRLTGQDTGRGTFSHRHAILFDSEDGRRVVPLQHLAPEQGRFDVVDTMLSEAAVLGFEYGYSNADPNTLVIWEAQFGDFANAAQVFIDQFLASAESKWRRMSGLTLYLPHGYEGQGPEHSSARLERFLELCANGNMQVCNLTTPGQLFHALRRQLHRRFRKPLVIMSPKRLLRLRLAVSPARELTDGWFRPVIDDTGVSDPAAVRRVLLTSGKFYYALLEARTARAAHDVALVRLEQLYPFPRQELTEVLARYARALDIRWVQEEPANMGAWRSLRHRLEAILPEGATLRIVARKASPTPATGFYNLHVEQEREVLERALAEPEAQRTGSGREVRPRPGERLTRRAHE